MENEIDISEAIQLKNKEMLINKRLIDYDKATESLLVFYVDFCKNYANNIKEAICSFKNIDLNSDLALEIKALTSSFIDLYLDELKKIIGDKNKEIKEKISLLDEHEYSKELDHMSLVIGNSIADYYSSSIQMLIEEFTKDVDEEVSKKINNYLNTMAFNKLINTLREQYTYAIKIIGNNNEENNQIMTNINEKTLNRV